MNFCLPTTHKKPKRKEIFILILCVLIGFALRFYTFDRKSLWIDEVHTFNEARYGLKDQIKYFKENPATLLHPPLFFILTHYLFYPFTKPERDLRVIPLVFGTLSILMIYFLSKYFSTHIALPCTLSLTFMTYHIYFSQDGRSYSLLMFLGMVALYFLVKHLKTSQRRDLFIAAFFYAMSFYTSYTSIPFIAMSQVLWFYKTDEDAKKPKFSSFLILNGIILLLCLPWIIFLALNYKGQSLMDTFSIQDPGSLGSIFHGILYDWVPLAPLMIVSIVLLMLYPIFSNFQRNALVALALFVLPIGGLYSFCRLFDINHFFSSKYLINFLPFFFILIFLSIITIEAKFEKIKRIFRLRLLFIILFIASNMTILPLYYRSEKQDFRGLVSYLEGRLRDGDKIFVKSIAYIPGILHYFRVTPESRHYNIPLQWTDPEKNEIECRIFLTGPDKRFSIIFSNSPFAKYIADESRLWIVAGKPAVKEIKDNFPCVLVGYFDGSFANFRKFPSDASMYLFLWDPKSPGEKGIEIPIK